MSSELSTNITKNQVEKFLMCGWAWQLLSQEANVANYQNAERLNKKKIEEDKKKNKQKCMKYFYDFQRHFYSSRLQLLLTICDMHAEPDAEQLELHS